MICYDILCYVISMYYLEIYQWDAWSINRGWSSDRDLSGFDSARDLSLKGDSAENITHTPLHVFTKKKTSNSCLYSVNSLSKTKKRLIHAVKPTNNRSDNKQWIVVVGSGAYYHKWWEKTVHLIWYYHVVYIHHK